MTTHIIAFIFYTLAMLGVIFVAFAVYKNIVFGQNTHISKLKIEDMLRLNQRKSLYVINYEGEKFLIASDIDSTTLISKLNTKETTEQMPKPVIIEKQEPKESLEEKLLEIKNSNTNSKNVMRTILKEINSKKERY